MASKIENNSSSFEFKSYNKKQGCTKKKYKQCENSTFSFEITGFLLYISIGTISGIIFAKILLQNFIIDDPDALNNLKNIENDFGSMYSKEYDDLLLILDSNNISLSNIQISPNSLPNDILLEGDRQRYIKLGKSHNKEPAFLYEKRSCRSPFVLRPVVCGRKLEKCPYKFQKAYKERNDILWVDYDLGDYRLLENGYALTGITQPAKRFYQGQKWDASKPAKYLINFLGRCDTNGLAKSGHHRSHLKFMIKNTRDIPPNVKLHCVDVSRKKANFDNFSKLLGNSNFSFVPHGEGRWSFRFTEAVGACSIPVIVADGLTLPYEQLIDWSDLVIRIPEEEFLNMNTTHDLISKLPTDPEKILEMRLKICSVNDAFLRTGLARHNAFYLSAKSWTRRKLSGLFFKDVNTNCKEPLRMCDNNLEPPLEKSTKTIFPEIPSIRKKGV